MSQVRVRFAPSPTGGLHIGGVRTALFNYLFAKKNNGTFILRIEDTDQSRFVEGAEQYIKKALNWLNIPPDEGPEEGGHFAPYKQSERKDIYKKYVDKLIEEGKAYYAFDSPEEIEEMRLRLKAEGVVNLNYNSASRMTMKNSLTLSSEEVNTKIENGERYVIRIKVPSKKEIRFKDLIRGWVLVHSNNMDDKVLMKSDGLPTYHLANVVDDHLMQISHVIRGEEWLPSAPLHVLMYEFFGWTNTMPVFAHLPLILKPDGNGKLSKRAADKAGFPIFPMTWQDAENEESIGFKEIGYLPEALINFLAFLGWNPGSDKEIFTLKELEEAFSLEKVGKAGTKFDIEKSLWFNEHYIKAKDPKEIAQLLQVELEERNIHCSLEKATKIVELVTPRVNYLNDFVKESIFLFQPIDAYDEKVIAKNWSQEAGELLSIFAKSLTEQENLNSDQFKSLFTEVIASNSDLKLGKMMPLLRLSLTGKSSGPDLMITMEILGEKSVAERIFNSLSALKEMTS